MAEKKEKLVEFIVRKSPIHAQDDKIYKPGEKVWLNKHLAEKFQKLGYAEAPISNLFDSDEDDDGPTDTNEAPEATETSGAGAGEDTSRSAANAERKRSSRRGK